MTPEERIAQLETQVTKLTRQVRQLRKWQAKFVYLISENKGITPQAIEAIITSFALSPMDLNEQEQLYQKAP